MIILALDTTTRGGSVAVTRDDEPLSLVHGDPTRTHGERMPGEIAQALDMAHVSKSAIDLIAVAAGPGAFTGLRIGLATAQGLALTLDRPVAGVSALDALAWEECVDRRAVRLVAPWMDAQRGDVFAALYRTNSGSATQETEGSPLEAQPWTVIEPAITSPPAVVLESWRERLVDVEVVFVGDATTRDAELIARAGQGRWGTRLPNALAPAIARIGRRLALDGRAGKPHDLMPIYVRRPDAELERERRGPS